METDATLARREQARHGGHLSLRIDSNAAHDVVHCWPDFHGAGRDVDIGELFELMVHARQLLLDVFGRVWKFFFDPRDIQEYAPVRTSPPFLDFANDAARDVIARQQLRRTTRLFIALA